MVSLFAGCSILFFLLGLIFIFVTCEKVRLGLFYCLYRGTGTGTGANVS
jgi:hypothetical protein